MSSGCPAENGTQGIPFRGGRGRERRDMKLIGDKEWAGKKGTHSLAAASRVKFPIYI